MQSERGKQLARARAEKVERSFEHVLDCGGAGTRRCDFRENIRKRYLIQAACANLSLLMRHLIGVGTPKQALAGAYPASIAFFTLIFRVVVASRPSQPLSRHQFRRRSHLRPSERCFHPFRSAVA